MIFCDMGLLNYLLMQWLPVRQRLKRLSMQVGPYPCWCPASVSLATNTSNRLRFKISQQDCLLVPVYLNIVFRRLACHKLS